MCTFVSCAVINSRFYEWSDGSNSGEAQVTEANLADVITRVLIILGHKRLRVASLTPRPPPGGLQHRRTAAGEATTYLVEQKDAGVSQGHPTRANQSRRRVKAAPR